MELDLRVCCHCGYLVQASAALYHVKSDVQGVCHIVFDLSQSKSNPIIMSIKISINMYHLSIPFPCQVQVKDYEETLCMKGTEEFIIVLEMYPGPGL